jgi:hypothetical protein
MKMKLLDKPDETSSSDPYYDLFDGGYIEPDKFLVPEDAAKVNAAIATVKEFLELLEENELLEEV